MDLVESGLPEEASRAVAAFKLDIPLQDVVRSPADLAVVGEQLRGWVETPESKEYIKTFVPDEIGIVNLSDRVPYDNGGVVVVDGRDFDETVLVEVGDDFKESAVVVAGKNSTWVDSLSNSIFFVGGTGDDRLECIHANCAAVLGMGDDAASSSHGDLFVHGGDDDIANTVHGALKSNVTDAVDPYFGDLGLSQRFRLGVRKAAYDSQLEELERYRDGQD